jgi:hypothetical protein
MLRRVAVCLAAWALLAAGCATVVKDAQQSLSVVAPDCPGATCKLQNDDGTWYVTVPGSVAVDRSYQDLVISCSHPEHPQLEFVGAWSSKTSGWILGNIILGGIVGAVIDVGTGNTYDYPDQIIVPLACRDTGQAAALPDAQPTPVLDAAACNALLAVLRGSGRDELQHRIAMLRYRQGCLGTVLDAELRVQRLADLRDAGLVSAEEYRQLRDMLEGAAPR